MRHGLHYILLCASMAATLTSCDNWFWNDLKNELDSKGLGIKVNATLSGNAHGTKAGASDAPTNIFTSADGDLTIEEYVSDIEFAPEAPVTKGVEITSSNLATAYGKFTVDAWAMLSENFPVPDGDKVATQYFKKDCEYAGSAWKWATGGVWEWDDSTEPQWITSTPITMWSYAPTSLSGITEMHPEVDQTTGKEFEKLSFSYAVPKTLENQEDIIVAYNKETRDFKLEPGYDDRYYYEFHANAADAQIFDDTNNPGDGKVDIHFYHALAAVKFEVDPAAKKGVDVHSITLCYIDNGTKTIVTNDGLATTGNCTVTGPDLDEPIIGAPGTGTAGVSWDNLGGKKPLHYEIPSDKSVRSGYAETGDGVLFMIPQTATNLSVIIEFTAGDANYYARVAEISSVNWQAGKYYTYRIMPKFNMPGELLFFGTTGITVTNLKSTPAQKLWSTDYSNTGIKKIGMIVDDYKWEGNTDGSINLSVCSSSTHESNPASSPFEYDFLPVTSIPNSGTAAEVTNEIYTIGDGIKETGYNTYYTYVSTSTHGARYLVFDVENINPFNIQVYNASGNNGARFTTNVRCVVVLEIEEDTSVPSNFPLNVWP